MPPRLNPKKNKAKKDKPVASKVTHMDNEELDRWVPIQDLSLFCGDEGVDLDKTKWDALDYADPRGFDWYKERFPGFPDDIIEILAKCDGTCTGGDDKRNVWDNKQAINGSIKRRRNTVIEFD